MSEDHTLCKLETKIAVLEKDNENKALALVLAEKLATAERKATIAIILSVLEFVVMVAIELLKR